MGDKLNLEENFIIYKNITLTIIETVKTGEYEKLEVAFKKRQLILDDINRINYTKVELNKLYSQYEIQDVEKKLAYQMNVKKMDLLEKIKDNKKRQAGMAGYNKISAKAVYLSKKV